MVAAQRLDELPLVDLAVAVEVQHRKDVGQRLRRLHPGVHQAVRHGSLGPMRPVVPSRGSLRRGDRAVQGVLAIVHVLGAARRSPPARREGLAGEVEVLERAQPARRHRHRRLVTVHARDGRHALLELAAWAAAPPPVLAVPQDVPEGAAAGRGAEAAAAGALQQVPQRGALIIL